MQRGCIGRQKENMSTGLLTSVTNEMVENMFKSSATLENSHKSAISIDAAATSGARRSGQTRMLFSPPAATFHVARVILINHTLLKSDYDKTRAYSRHFHMRHDLRGISRNREQCGFTLSTRISV
ncbi:hypothetical protein H9Q73_000388 [Fusarium xylarioides]|nr:hypothetical protein H9Q73_000388 [Fusarium xylarioides]